MISFVLALGTAQAAPFVLLDRAEQRTPALEATLAPGTTVMTWSAMQDYPLAWDGTVTTTDCLTDPVSVAALTEQLERVESALAYMETGNAAGHVRQLKGSALCATAPLPAALLARAHYLSGMASYIDGKVEAARTSWRQAFLVDAALVWDDAFEPSGKPVFEEVRDQLQYEPTAKLRVFPDSAKLVLNGTAVAAGADLHEGRHFVQQPSRDHAAQLIETRSGVDAVAISFADFPTELEGVMDDTTMRRQLLRGLRILDMGDDLRVVAGQTAWTLPRGAADWTGQPWTGGPDPSAKTKATDSEANRSETSSASRTRDRKRRPLQLVGLGGAALGAAALAWSWAEYDNFQEFTVRTPDAEATYQRQRALWFSGVGLVVAGTGVALGGSF